MIKVGKCCRAQLVSSYVGEGDADQEGNSSWMWASEVSRSASGMGSQIVQEEFDKLQLGLGMQPCSAVWNWTELGINRKIIG